MLYIPQENELKGMTTFEKCIYLDKMNKQNPDMERMLNTLNGKEERSKTKPSEHIKLQLTTEKTHMSQSTTSK